VTNTYFSSLVALIVSCSLGFIYEILIGSRKRLQAGNFSVYFFLVWASEDKRADRGDGTGEYAEEETLLPRRLSFSRMMLRGKLVAISVKRRSIRSTLRVFEIASIVCMLCIASTGNIVYILSIAAGKYIVRLYNSRCCCGMFLLWN
jgi:hypothetical protein